MFNRIISHNYILRNVSKIKNIRNYCINTKKYLESHEWYMPNKNNNINLGLSKTAIDMMNDVIYIDIDGLDKTQIFETGEGICEIESVKSVEYLNSPLTCRVIRYNEKLLDDLEKLNKDPENDDNWILELQEIKN